MSEEQVYVMLSQLYRLFCDHVLMTLFALFSHCAVVSMVTAMAWCILRRRYDCRLPIGYCFITLNHCLFMSSSFISLYIAYIY